jgi:hypothetical protein
MSDCVGLFKKIRSMPNNNKKKVSPAKWLSVRNTKREREFDFLRFPEKTTMENGGEKMSVYTQGGSRVTLDKTRNVAQGLFLVKIPPFLLEIK